MARRKAPRREANPPKQTPLPPLPAREVEPARAPAADASPQKTAAFVVAGALVALVAAAAWRGRERPPSVAPVAQDTLPVAAPEPAADDDLPGAPGVILRTPRELPEPADVERDDRCAEAHRGWLFPGGTSASVGEVLRAAGFDDATRARVLAATTCEGPMCTANPDNETLLALPAEARGRMYRALGRYNGAVFSAIPFRRPLRFGAWAELPGLPEAARDLLRRTTWREGDVEYFVDLPLACDLLPDPAARDAIVRALDRRYTLDVAVRPPPGVPLDALARYWSAGRPRAEVRALFERAARQPDGAVPLRDLLPEMPRRRLDTFRALSEPPYDCFWTALHFFDGADNAPPPGPAGFAAELASSWREVDQSSLRFGDMIVLSEGADAVHAMTLLAEDLVLTKNGGHGRRPWVVMTIDEVKRDYVLARTERYYRRRAR